MPAHKQSPKPQEIIPIMHCFDERYSAPAAVSFLSMLENASRAYFYKIFVLQSDISEHSKERLCEVVGRFDNAELVFIDMQHKFRDLFAGLKTKGHYSKEMFYKLLVPSIFRGYDRLIVSDVDVVFAGDIARLWEVDLGENYLAGVSYKESKWGGGICK